MTVLSLRKEHCVLRARGTRDRVDLEMTIYRPNTEPLKRQFSFIGWDHVCELAYALEQAMQGQLLKVVQWYDSVHRTVAMLFFRLEDYGNGDLKGRIYLRIADAQKANLPEAERETRSDDESTRIRLTRLEAYKLRLLALRSILDGTALKGA